jgi:hypothetical protein
MTTPYRHPRTARTAVHAIAGTVRTAVRVATVPLCAGTVLLACALIFYSGSWTSAQHYSPTLTAAGALLALLAIAATWVVVKAGRGGWRVPTVLIVAALGFLLAAGATHSPGGAALGATQHEILRAETAIVGAVCLASLIIGLIINRPQKPSPDTPVSVPEPPTITTVAPLTGSLFRPVIDPDQPTQDPTRPWLTDDWTRRSTPTDTPPN